MRVYSRHGVDPNIPTLSAPQPVRLPQDQLECGKQAYFLRGPVRKDVAQVHESVVENLVTRRRADRVTPGTRFPRREREGSRGLGQFSEHGVELIRAKLARDQFDLSEVRQVDEAHRVHECENERARSRLCAVRFRQLARYPREDSIVPFDHPLPFALQPVAVLRARGRFARAVSMHSDTRSPSWPSGTVHYSLTQ